MAEPENEPAAAARTDGREPDGRFAVGNPGGPGRPRGYDFHTLLLEQLKTRGETVEVVFGEVVNGLRGAVNVPSCAAAASKVLLDRICGPVPAHVSISDARTDSDEAFL